jgi:hypothetical protein
MRPVLTCLLVLTAVPAWANAQGPPPSSAAMVVRIHPGPWQLPASLMAAGIRFEPETGEAATDLAAVASRSSTAALRARAEANVRVMPDGSRHVALNGAVRMWTVATIDDQGRVVQDCVHNEAEARQRIEAAARKADCK